jgi:CHAD domain-containing protein
VASTHLEVERKYDAGADTALPDLMTLPGVASVAEPERHDLEAVYYDTDDLALAAGRITLRRRTGGDDAGWHLKVPAGSGERQEVRLPLGRATRTPPKELRQATLAFTRGAPLTPVATLRTRRTVHRLLAADGSCLAEVCEDDVRAFDGASGHDLLAWREWEVELVNGTESLLDRVDALMNAAGLAPAEAPSKLARVLGDRLKPATPPARPRRKGPVGAVLQARLAEQVEVLKRRDIDVRRDTHEGVHQLRVAMRRLRSALATFRPLVDRDVTDPLREEVQWIAGMLGEARDAEVMRQRLDQMVAAQPVELVLGGVSARVRHTLGTRYREGLAAAVEAMESVRYLDLLAALDRLVADPPWTPLAQQRASDALPELLRRDWKRLRKAVSAIDAAADRPSRDVALHESRKAAKRMRYAAEAARPVLGKDARRVAAAAKAAQTVLGEHHDSVVTRQVLRQLGVQAQLDGDSAFTFGLLYGLEEWHAAALEEEFRHGWSAQAQTLRRIVG